MTATSASTRLSAQELRVEGVRYHPMEFAADGTPATGPLTWSQQKVLRTIEALSPATDPLNLRFHHALPDGTTEAGVLDALRELVRGHEALRTRYTSTPDGPGQCISTEGCLDVAIVECRDARSAGEAVPEVMATLAGRPFDMAEEWPLRIALITADGTPSCLVFAACHLVVDGYGAVCLRDHLGRLLTRSTAEPVPQRPPHSHLAQAAYERSPAGVRNAARAVEHHERTYSGMPQTMLPRRAREPEPPQYRYLQFESEALALAVPALVARHRTNPATVLYAGLAAVSAFVSGLPRAYLQVTMSNRVEARLRDAVGSFAQDVPICVEVADASVADVIARSASAVLQSARFGRYSPGELIEARRRVELRRGVSLDLSCWLNYVPTSQLAAASETPGAYALEEARSRSRWRWIAGTDSSTSTYFVFAHASPQLVTLTVIVDTAVLPASEAIAWLRTFEQALCASVTGEVGIPELGGYADLVPQAHDRDWCLTDAGWAFLPDVAELVRQVNGARQVEVFAEESEHGPEITAYLHGAVHMPAIEQLHAACVSVLPGQRTAMAPHRYVVCAGAPDRSGIAAWRTLPVLAEGSGR